MGDEGDVMMTQLQSAKMPWVDRRTRLLQGLNWRKWRQVGRCRPVEAREIMGVSYD